MPLSPEGQDILRELEALTLRAQALPPQERLELQRNFRACAYAVKHAPRARRVEVGVTAPISPSISPRDLGRSMRGAE